MPMVKSVVIIGKFKSVPSLFKDDEEKFWDFVRKMFSLKRKNLLNNLCNYTDAWSKKMWEQKFIEWNWSIQKRAEECEIEDFKLIFQTLLTFNLLEKKT
jgi:16S rRNA A1518/A1519 N6-dimethyltransferase RsmA/KsgA/DIM1 with predicted DNA glycosylase/AP lyase activity